MARRSSSGVQISLFPFLSILASLIGCLIVIIVTLTIAQLNKDEGREPEEVERARAYLEMEREQQEHAQRIEELKQRVDNVIQNRQNLMEMREKLQQFKALAESSEKMDALRDELITQLNLLKQENAGLDTSLQDLIKQIEALKIELADRQAPPDKPAIQLRPGGSSKNSRPYFVEVTDASVIIHGKGEEPIQIPTANLQSSDEFVDLLKTIEAEPYRVLIFLVRGNEGSIANLNKANAVVNNFARSASREFRAAKMPLPGEGKIDFSVFEELME